MFATGSLSDPLLCLIVLRRCAHRWFALCFAMRCLALWPLSSRGSQGSRQQCVALRLFALLSFAVLYAAVRCCALLRVDVHCVAVICGHGAHGPRGARGAHGGTCCVTLLCYGLLGVRCFALLCCDVRCRGVHWLVSLCFGFVHQLTSRLS